MRSAPYPPLLFVFVLPAVPLVLAESGGLLGDWTGAEDEDEDELDGVLVVVELSAGGVADELLLIELLSEGVVLLVELGVEEVLDVELGVLMSVVDEVVDEEEGVDVVALLLRSQPATAAEARARAATRGMSLFMTSPIRNGCDVGRSLTGPGGRCVQRPMTTHNACQCLSLGNGAGDAESGRETFRRD